MTLFWILTGFLAYTSAANLLSYRLIKNRVLRRRKWDLNICCGRTDGGGVNADIRRYTDLPNFVLVENVEKLPFRDGQFTHVLSSHTIEHVESPAAFYRELCRVGESVTLVLPPLWDLSAAFNILEHRHLFLTLRKVHTVPPRYVRLPGAAWIQRHLGQRIKA